MINSRNIDDLQPYVAYKCRQLIDEAKKQGLALKVIGTLRDQEQQTVYYKKGTGSKLIGPHGYGLAFDIVPLQPDGSINWNDYTSFNKMGTIGKSLGLEWGGDWKRVDCPHFQYTQGLTDAQIRAGKLPKFPKELNELDNKEIADLKKQVQALTAQINEMKANARAAQQFLKRINPDFIG